MSFYPHRYLKLLSPLYFSFEKMQTTEGIQLQRDDSPLPIRCRYCRAAITLRDSAIEMNGMHQHVLTNPAGISFTVVLYRNAQCNVSGSPTEEFSWFQGYAWQMAHCGSCGVHLGWYYSQAQFLDFYGLIASRLDFTIN